MSPAPPLMTLDVYFKTPETVKPAELARGVLRVAESPSARHQSAVMDLFAYWHETTNIARASSQSDLTTLASNGLPERVVSCSDSPAFGTDGTVIIFLNLTELWSIGYPFSSSDRTFMLGIRRLTSTAWIVGSAVGAVAGVLIAPLTFLHSNMMLSPLIKAFAVAALGGLSSLVGAYVGGLLLGLTENIAVQYMPSYLKDSLAFVFILVVLLLRPEGLFGTQAKEKV